MCPRFLVSLSLIDDKCSGAPKLSDNFPPIEIYILYAKLMMWTKSVGGSGWNGDWMKVTVKYYGLASEVGIKEETIVLDGSTYASLKAILETKYHPLTYTPALCLKEGVPMSSETKLKDGDTVAFVRQIGGG